MSKILIGDRIKVYHGWKKPMIGKCVGVNEDGLIQFTEDGFYSAHNDSPFHPKQCRKLNKKKPREIWVHEVKDETKD